MHTIIATIVLIIGLLMQQTPNGDIVTEQISADLDGDGVEEPIALEHMHGRGDFTLAIGADRIEGYIDPWVDRMLLVDIDTSDGRMEIAVETSGPSDDYGRIYYTYVNNRIEELGYVDGEAVEEGNGDIHTSVWMGFWSRRDVYRLDRSSGLLEPLDQDIYTVRARGGGSVMAIDCTVLEPFQLYTHRDKDVVLVELEEGEAVAIMACHFAERGTSDDIELACGLLDWYLMVNEEGLAGWAQYGNFRDKVEGIVGAD